MLYKLYNRIIDNLVILPIEKSCRPMLQYSHDENNKRQSRKAGRKVKNGSMYCKHYRASEKR